MQPLPPVKPAKKCHILLVLQIFLLLQPKRENSLLLRGSDDYVRLPLIISSTLRLTVPYIITTCSTYTQGEKVIQGQWSFGGYFRIPPTTSAGEEKASGNSCFHLEECCIQCMSSEFLILKRENPRLSLLL